MYYAEDSELKAVKLSKKLERRKKKPKEKVFPDLDLRRIQYEEVNHPHHSQNRGEGIRQLELRCDALKKPGNKMARVNEAGYDQVGIGAGYEATYGLGWANGAIEWQAYETDQVAARPCHFAR